ncbi:TP53-target gene 5 protein [Octodon degus]|uniref:TP53-target gene 5 protein n=1 Tax=Octodon degus TaxID=10160 RepID=A0A6P6EEY0_OCTDE|nr:TP53-target gene 5 protein [Octodon degus]
MCPSAKKKLENRMASKMEEEKLQDKTKQTVYKTIQRSRLKMVLRNLSLLKLLKSSNSRIQELYNLARRCWNSMLRVPKILRASSGENNVCNKVRPNNEELQDATCLEKNLESKKIESTGKPKQARPDEYKEEPRARNMVEDSPVTVPRKEEQMEPDFSRTSIGHGLKTGAQKRQLFKRGPRVVFLKTYNYRAPMGDMKQLDVNGQYIWFEGLPTRIHLPGPRVLCRASKLRWVKRRCTRFCSASLEKPMYHSYKVV